MGRGRGVAREGELIKKFQPPDGGGLLELLRYYSRVTANRIV